MARRPTRDRLAGGRAIGLIAGATGLTASLYVLFVPVIRYTTTTPGGTTTTGTAAGIDYLLGTPGAQFALFAWPVLLGGVTVIGAAGAWRGRPRWTGAAALALAAFVVAGLPSIGLLYVPAAGLLLVATVLGREG